MTDEVKRWTVPGKKLAPLRYETVEVVAAAEFDALADELAAERADHADTMKRAQEAWRIAEKRGADFDRVCGERDALGAALAGAMEAIEGEWVGLNGKLPEWAQPWADALAAWRRTGEGDAAA